MSTLFRNVAINAVVSTIISGTMIGGSMHYLGSKHHETFQEFYDKHKTPKAEPEWSARIEKVEKPRQGFKHGFPGAK
jgi:hypothetical protein